MRWLLIVICCFECAVAHADTRGFAGVSYIHRHSELGGANEYPLAGFGIDAWGPSRFGFHGQFASGYSYHTQNGSPCCYRQFDWMLELHAMYAYRDAPVTIGFGLGLNLTGKNAKYDDPDAMPDSQTFSSASPSIGPRIDLGVDLFQWRGGQVELLAGAAMFSIPQLLGLCGGEISCERQTYTFTLSLAFAKH